ncbi:MAG: DUF4445 domain-containing protein [Ruminococcaceae bacterium]|nr:DUF4445 domain-containing protein [Oscillospiraceae bacterium]
MADATVTIHTADGAVRVCRAPMGSTLLSVCAQQSLMVEAPCGGSGKCGKCRVAATGRLSPRTTEEAALPEGERLACLARVAGDCEVRLGQRQTMHVETAGLRRTWQLAPWADPKLGAAIDIGTTTVVVYLYDLSSGEQLAVLGAENRQRTFGADVISRITYSMTDPEGLARLSTVIRTELTELLQTAAARAGRSTDEITCATVAGNTVMAHLFAGLSPAGLSKLPFAPETLFDDSFSADPAWLGLAPTAKLRILPAISAFVGGDISAAALAVSLHEATEPTILLDIGTNGEMALAVSGRILCCATAAGPAFEGADIECGMSGTDGAIDAVRLADGKLAFTVIGGGEAVGLCGSGLIDLLAALLALGAVDETGRLLPPDEAPDAALPYLKETDDGDVICALTETVFVTERDVRRLQLAKAAIAGGIATLLDEAGLTPADVGTVCIAGGFGAHLNPESAAAIGLYPAEWRGRANAVGNAAGAGASAALCSSAALATLYALANSMQTLELSADPRFTEYYVENMMF